MEKNPPIDALVAVIATLVMGILICLMNMETKLQMWIVPTANLCIGLLLSVVSSEPEHDTAIGVCIILGTIPVFFTNWLDISVIDIFMGMCAITLVIAACIYFSGEEKSLKDPFPLYTALVFTTFGISYYIPRLI
jgi:hypothetical protein